MYALCQSSVTVTNVCLVSVVSHCHQRVPCFSRQSLSPTCALFQSSVTVTNVCLVSVVSHCHLRVPCFSRQSLSPTCALFQSSVTVTNVCLVSVVSHCHQRVPCVSRQSLSLCLVSVVISFKITVVQNFIHSSVILTFIVLCLLKQFLQSILNEHVPFLVCCNVVA